MFCSTSSAISTVRRSPSTLIRSSPSQVASDPVRSLEPSDVTSCTNAARITTPVIRVSNRATSRSPESTMVRKDGCDLRERLTEGSVVERVLVRTGRRVARWCFQLGVAADGAVGHRHAIGGNHLAVLTCFAAGTKHSAFRLRPGRRSKCCGEAQEQRADSGQR